MITQKTDKDQVYVLIDKNLGYAVYSKMLKPLADYMGKDRTTIKRWLARDDLAQKKNYLVYVADKVVSGKEKL